MDENVIAHTHMSSSTLLGGNAVLVVAYPA